MIRILITSVVSSVLLIALFSPAAYAQEAAQEAAQQATVEAHGAVVLRRMPSSMRLTIQLSEKAKTLKQALSKLKDRRAAAVLVLKKLKAKEGSIVLSDSLISTTVSAQQRQIQQLLTQRRRRGGKAVKTSPPITVVCAVVADWPITASSTEQLLMTTKTIQDQVIAADLAGVNEPKNLSPAEEELAEEAAEHSNQFGGYDEEEGQPGKPHFMYVARITEKQRKEALAAAFVKSKKKASDLAAAAGATLGPLAQISAGMMNQNNNRGYGGFGGGRYGYSNRMYMQQMMMAQAKSGDDGEQNENESFSAVLGKVSFQFLLQAKFHLK